jgi:hypothetical protein
MLFILFNINDCKKNQETNPFNDDECHCNNVFVIVDLKKNIMNQTHIHLLITHLPIYGSMIGAFVLLYGIWSSSIQTKIVSNWMLMCFNFTDSCCF